jgi:hypothetical protein
VNGIKRVIKIATVANPSEETGLDVLLFVYPISRLGFLHGGLTKTSRKSKQAGVKRASGTGARERSAMPCEVA